MMEGEALENDGEAEVMAFLMLGVLVILGWRRRLLGSRQQSHWGQLAEARDKGGHRRR